MPDLLDGYLAAERQMPFEWSSLRNGDCQLFILGWAERIGWPEAGMAWRGRYSSEAEARALLKSRGGSIIAGCEIFGPPRMGSSPRRGDIGLLEVDGWHLGVICTGRMWAFRAGKRGVCLSRRDAEVVWDMRLS